MGRLAAGAEGLLKHGLDAASGKVMCLTFEAMWRLCQPAIVPESAPALSVKTSKGRCGADAASRKAGTRAFCLSKTTPSRWPGVFGRFAILRERSAFSYTIYK